MSERPEQLQVVVLKEWLSFMRDNRDSAARVSPFDTEIVVRNTLNYITHLEAQLAKAQNHNVEQDTLIGELTAKLEEAKADSKRLDKLEQALAVDIQKVPDVEYLGDVREAIDKLEEPEQRDDLLTEANQP